MKFKHLLIIFSLAINSVQATPLNDTGQTNFTNSTGNTVVDEPKDYSGQDARFGRDAAAKTGTLSKHSSGNNGFDFTKIAEDGRTLTDLAPKWACILDNVTGLTWEVKTNDKGFRDQNWSYSWYNSNTATNGGSSGTATGGNCLNGRNCDTEKFTSAVNKTRLCGFDDWRLPTFQELISIVDYGKIFPSIDIFYFPNTLNDWYWTASSAPGLLHNIRRIDFSVGNADATSIELANGKPVQYRVRLVRGQSFALKTQTPYPIKRLT